MQQNNNDQQKAPSSSHAALGMLAALAPIKLQRTNASPAESNDTSDDSPAYSPPTSRRTMIPAEIASNPLVAMDYIKRTNETEQR